jgi:hypothetical protein
MDIVKKTLDALEVLEAEGITVQQGWYDADIKGLHVTVWNLGTTAANIRTMTKKSRLQQCKCASGQVQIKSG